MFCKEVAFARTPSSYRLYLFYLNSVLVCLLLSLLVVGDASQVRNLFGLIALLYVAVCIKQFSTDCKPHNLWISAMLFYGSYHIVHVFFWGNPAEHLSNYYKFILLPVFFAYLYQVGFWRFSVYLGAALGTFFTLYFGIHEVLATPARYRIGIGHNPIVLATLLLVYVVILVESFFDNSCIWIKCLSGLLISGLIFLIVNTGARGAYLTLLCLSLVYAIRVVYQLKSKHKMLGLALLILAVFIVGSWGVQHPTVQGRYHSTLAELQRIQQGDFGSSIGLRLNSWYVASAMIIKKPVLGYGEAHDLIIAESEQVVKEQNIEVNTVANLSHIHNEFLQSWVEYGILGLCSLLFVYVAFIYGVPSHARWMLAAYLLIFLLLSLIDSTFKNNILVTAFFVVGSILRIHKCPATA